VQSKDLNTILVKALSLINAHKLKSKYLDSPSFTKELISKEVSNKSRTHAIVILSGGRQKGALDLP
jgi:hypothetical protein